MNIQTKHENGVLFVKPLDKSIEGSNSREFKGQVVDLFNEGNKNIVLNLSQVEFMDSSGLGCLISILKLMVKAEGQISICEPQEQVIRLFNLTRLNNVFRIFSKEDEALNTLGTLTPLNNDE